VEANETTHAQKYLCPLNNLLIEIISKLTRTPLLGKQSTQKIIQATTKLFKLILHLYGLYNCYTIFFHASYTSLCHTPKFLKPGNYVVYPPDMKSRSSLKNWWKHALSLPWRSELKNLNFRISMTTTLPTHVDGGLQFPLGLTLSNSL